MTGWQSQMPGCVGTEDGIFAGHPTDEQRAWELLDKLRKEGISWEKVEREFRKHLKGRGLPQKHVDEQIESVKRHMKPWLG